jgi:hypothetical protein
MHYQEDYDYDGLMTIVNELKRREGKQVELVTNSDAGNKCADWTEKEPWVEFSLWGYDYRGGENPGDKKDFRCHFCKELLSSEPKPFEAICGTDSCEALWGLTMMDAKKNV